MRRNKFESKFETTALIRDSNDHVIWQTMTAYIGTVHDDFNWQIVLFILTKC